MIDHIAIQEKLFWKGKAEFTCKELKKSKMKTASLGGNMLVQELIL